MTIYGLLASLPELVDANGMPKVFKTRQNSITGLYVTVTEEDENQAIAKYSRGSINNKLIDVNFYFKAPKSNEGPEDDSIIWKILKQDYEPRIQDIDEDSSGKSVLECFPVTQPSVRFDAKEREFKAYSRIRIVLDSAN